MDQQPDLGALFRVFGRIGLLSFGGPAAQIALMHRELVEERPWLSEAQFLRALSFCMLLPGPEAMQLASYAGWRLRGVVGGLIAGGLFVLPGALVIAALAWIYLSFGALPLVKAAFLGIQATVLVVVAQAIGRLSAKALKSPADKGLAVLAFLALFAFGLPFPVVIAVAALWGAWRARAAAPDVAGGAATGLPPLRRSLRLGALFAALWAVPLGVAALIGADFLLNLGLFFSKLALVTFGGAYAVLAYMTQEIVVTHGWLSTAQMIDALGLAETTPGPLILVTQFAAHLAGAAQGQAALAGLMALWVTFVPCFLWIFAGAPLIDWLEHQPRIAAALQAITAAVVGVIANLSLWFGAHILFASVGQIGWGPAQIVWPAPGSLRPEALALTLLAALLLLGAPRGLRALPLRRPLPLPVVLPLMAAAAIMSHLLLR